MADKIKLENIVHAGFDTETGDEFMNITEEYACSSCRNLVAETDKFCWRCGELLKDAKVEHYQKGEKLTDKEFKKRAGRLSG